MGKDLSGKYKQRRSEPGWMEKKNDFFFIPARPDTHKKDKNKNPEYLSQLSKNRVCFGVLGMIQGKLPFFSRCCRR